MEYRVLGKLEVVRGREPVELGAFRQRSLLALLLTEPNTVFSTDRVIDELWGDEAGSDKQNALWVYVSGLRTALEPERKKRSEGSIVLTRAPGYLLNVEADAVDALRFERLVAEARALAESDPGAASVMYRSALALWRGRAYEEFTYESFAQAEIARLSELRTDAIEARIDADLASGSSSVSVAELEGLVGQHPLRERFTEQLMVAMYRSGRQAEALRAFSTLRSHLVEELGIEPSSRLRDLHDQLVVGGDELAPAERVDLIGTGRSPRLSIRGYELREQIGESTFGIVHRAYQPVVGREVAVKVVRPESANDPEFIRHFESEAQLVARLEHPHIVPLYDYWREPDAAYLVTRLMRGGSVGDVIERRGLTPEEAVRVATQLGGALATAHRAGVIHRNIKPSNILLDEAGNAYLSDFGIATGGHDGDRAGSANPVGGPYAPPEQFADGPVTASADIYSLGVVLAQGLTGLFGRVEEIRGALLPHVLPVIDRATSDRGAYDDVGQFVADLAAALDDAEFEFDDTVAENPYKGLRPFEAADEADFFGRTRLVERLVARVGDPSSRGRFVGLVGASGSGKSSVVKAGLIPALRRGALPGSESWYVLQMAPAPHPFERLEEALLSIAVDPPASLMEILAGSEHGLRQAVQRTVPLDGTQLLLVIDQFEELFTQVDEATRRRFLTTLVDAVKHPHSDVRVLITLRADFYDLPLRHRELGELLRDGTEVITMMSPDELADAITGPGGRAGVTFEPTLVAELVRDVVDRAGSLPLLQYTLTELFEHRQGRRLTAAAYHELGSVSGLLASRAEGVLSQLGGEAVGVARQVFLRLVTLGEGTDDSRRRVRRSELEQIDIDQRTLDDVLEAFGRHRLLSFDRDPVTRGPTVEISHEALLVEWGRLRDWVDGARDDVRHQRRLATAAGEWVAAGRSADHLLTGGTLDRLEAWAAASSVSLGNVERDFLDESVLARERSIREIRERESMREAAESRARRRLRVTAGAVAVAAFISVLAVVAFVQAREAHESREELAATLRSQDLAAASTLQLRTDLDLAVALALAAADATAGLGVITPEAMDALHWVVQQSNVTYPADESTPVAVRPGPRGATGVFHVAPDELVALVAGIDTAGFTPEQCVEFFPTGACPGPDRPSPVGLEIQGGEAAYGVVSPGPGALAGTSVELLHAIEGDAGFVREIERFEEETGIVVSVPTQARPEFELQRRPADLEPEPDIVFWPQPRLVTSQPAGSLIDLAAYLDVEQLRDDVGSRLLSLGTVGTDGSWPGSDGAVVGLPIDVDLKGLVFYPRDAFERAGYEVPASWNDLVRLSDRIVADGRTPWCFHFGSGPASGWPGTDLLETTVAREGGVGFYDLWRRHEVPFDHPTVRAAADKAEQLLTTDEYVRGGTAAISRFDVFTEGLTPLLTEEPQCWLYHQADFMMTLAPDGAVIGHDIDAFPFPPSTADEPLPALGGGSLMSALGDRPEIRAFVQAAAAPTWGEAWASPAASSFISPNARFDVNAYAAEAEEAERSFSLTVGMVARDAIAADRWRFDASDLMPEAIGSISDGAPGAFWVGMIDVVDGRRSMDQVLADIEAEWQQLEAG